MKHLTPMTVRRPAEAALWQDILCNVVSVFSGLLRAFGGASPLADYIDDKCLIPPPNGD